MSDPRVPPLRDGRDRFEGDFQMALGVPFAVD